MAKFWNDLFSGRIVCTPDNAAGILEEHELSDLKDAVFSPVLVSVESLAARVQHQRRGNHGIRGTQRGCRICCLPEAARSFKRSRA
ncbi:hypothetical protein VQ056_13370 [Paenibacillus sp. JTLBN-2024]